MIKKDKIFLIIGIANIGLGICYILGWFFGWIHLIQLSNYSYVQFNTALGIFFSSLVFLLIHFHSYKLARNISWAVLFISFLTLIENLFNVNFKIDELIIQDYINEDGRSPGRMSPFTALSFFLLNLSIIFTLTRRGKNKIVIGSCLTLSILVFNSISLSGYFFELNSVLNWRHFNELSPQTAFSLFLLCVCYLSFAWDSYSHEEKTIPFWAAPIFGITIFSIFLVFGLAGKKQEFNYLKRTVQLIAESFKYQFLIFLEEQTLAMERMASRFETINQIPKNIWEKDALNYINHYKNFQAIVWVDPTYKARWIAPLKGNEKFLNLDFSLEKRIFNTLQKAIRNKTSFFSESFNLVPDDKGFILGIPLFKENQFNGFILGIFNVNNFFSEQIKKITVKGAAFTVFENGQIIYSSTPLNQPPPHIPSHKTSVKFKNLSWEIEISPKGEVLNLSKYHKAEALIVFGTLISFFVGFTMFFYRKSEIQVLENLNINKALISEISTRKNAEEKLKEGESFLQNVIDNAIDGIITIDEKGIIETFSKQAEKLFGYSSDEVIGKNVSILMPEPYGKEHNQYINNYLQSGNAQIIGIGRELKGLRGPLKIEIKF